MSAVIPGVWPRVPERAPKLSALPDEELMLAYVLHEDRTAFAELYRRLSPDLMRYAARRIPRESAEDLVQQAFLNAQLARERFALGSAVRPWLTRILVNLVRDHLRARRNHLRSDIDVHELATGPREAVALHESREAIRRARHALSELSPSQRDVLRLHWLEERPFPEVARALGVRLSTAKVRAHRAYKELRRALGDSDETLVRACRKC
ncbi:MAG TPA: sigma-70 family RNA polymerase sigma factor [Polyangiaceae bacterium]|nr:sigma-70 family RNA polymerase sigma factor [Polyangiaceae bacterium]